MTEQVDPSPPEPVAGKPRLPPATAAVNGRRTVTSHEPIGHSLAIHLFPDVTPFYQAMAGGLEQAHSLISMMYLIWDDGECTRRLGAILRRKSAQGIPVRLMVDGFGQAIDHLPNAIRNLRLVRELEDAGIQMCVFWPKGPRLGPRNRLHIKMCAVDDDLLFMGGSNVGHQYPTWLDTNFRLSGDIGSAGHQLYDFVARFSASPPRGAPGGPSPEPLDDGPPRRRIGDASVLMTLPGRRRDIREAMLDLILGAERAIYLREWYFLPDAELLNALLHQCARGVHVNILHSHRTRVRPVDLASQVCDDKLARAGASVYRYLQAYMHAKVAWTDEGDVILGSANIESQSMEHNFELCLRTVNPQLAQELTDEFSKDCQSSLSVDANVLARMNPFARMLSHLIAAAGRWL